jgi:hypothetical protein
VPLGGSYSLAADHTGTLVLGLPYGTNDWKVAVAADGDRAFIQAYFSPEVLSSTVLLRTDPARFSNAGIDGSYVFLLEGADVAGTRVVDIGRFNADGAGNIVSGALETNAGGALSSTLLTGSYSVAANGRAAATLTIAGRSFSFALYVIDAERLVMVSNDDLAAGVPARVGYAFRQVGAPFSAAALAGDYVFELAGRHAATSAIVTVGRLSSTGAGAASGQYDRNDNYAITVGGGLSASYTIDSSGRGLMDSPQLGPLVFYLVSPHKAVLMGAPDARAQAGTLERQQAAPYSTANLVGEFAQGTAGPAAQNSLTVTARVVYDGAGIETSTQLVNALPPCGQQSGSTVAPYTVSATGRIEIRDSGGSPLAAGYLIDPGRYVLILQRQKGSVCDEVVQINHAAQ